MEDQQGIVVSLDSVEDWIVKYREALAQDLKRSQGRNERFRSAIENFVRQVLRHFKLNMAAGFHLFR